MSAKVTKSDAGFLPPVMSSADNPAERQEVLSFFDHYIGQNANAVAQTENKRLSYYFEALDKRFAKALPESKGGAKKPFSLVTYLVPPMLRDHKPKDVYKTGDLNTIFNRITQLTRSIILSEVLVLPHSFISDKELFSRKEVYSGGLATNLLASNKDDKRGFHFGFYDVRQMTKGIESNWYNYDSDIALPVFALDTDMLNPIASHQPQKMLRALQSVLTYCNHDMMHNMVNTATKGDISRPTEAHYKEELKLFMEHKTGSHGDNDVLGFESALILGHARTWEYLKDTPVSEDLQQAVTTFYDELDRLSDCLQSDENLDPALHHQVVDYFALAVPFALVRMLPLHDPLMNAALARAEKATPNIDAVLSQDSDIDLSAKNDNAANTVKYYRQAGTPLAQDESSPQNYAEVKKLQLVRMVPDITIVLTPAPKGTPTFTAHARADEMDRDITNIILSNAKKPPQY